MTSKGQEHSRYQRGIIQRYYEHGDTIALQKLSEIVSDLYLAEGGQVTKLWNSARQALAKLAPADDPHIMKVLSTRSVTGLAKLITELSAGAKATGSDVPHPPRALPLVDETSAAGAKHETAPISAPMPATSVVEPPIPGSPATPTPPTHDELKHAMRAFRKRLKLTRLDEESKLGRVGNPMSGGKKSQIVAIMAPREYSQAVWDELVRQGRLRKSGSSFYELSDGT